MPASAQGGPAKGTPVTVRSTPRSSPITICFAGPIRGLMTHYYKRDPYGCQGPDLCPPAVHKSNTVWKGYAPGREYLERLQRWVAYAVEVTECLEEQLRGQDLRGQVWTLCREGGHRVGGKVIGHYLERRQEPELTGGFDVLPALLRMYHCSYLELDVPNPIAPRLCLPDVSAPPPEALRPATPAEPSPASREEIARLIADAKRRLGAAPPANGRR